MTKIAATDSLVTPTIKAVCDWYGVHPKFAHAVLETFLGVDYERGISEISEFLARYERYRIQLDYTFSTNARGQKLAKQLKEWGGGILGSGRAVPQILSGCWFCLWRVSSRLR